MAKKKDSFFIFHFLESFGIFGLSLLIHGVMVNYGNTQKSWYLLSQVIKHTQCL